MGKDGVLRIGGCLGNRVDSPHPIIMPRDKEVVSKLLDKFHVDNGHAGAATTSHICRRYYWVLQGGAAARSVVTHCFHCKKRFKTPEFQKMAMHPKARCTPAYPFEATGVDLAGPYSLHRKDHSQEMVGYLHLPSLQGCPRGGGGQIIQRVVFMRPSSLSCSPQCRTYPLVRQWDQLCRG